MAKPDPSPVHDSDPLFGALQAGLGGWHRARLKCLHLALVALLSSADNVSLPALGECKELWYEHGAVLESKRTPEGSTVRRTTTSYTPIRDKG